MYHWSHLELKRYFGIEETLSPKTCEAIWNKCNEIINSDDFSARAMIKKSNVKYIGTTDDPIDNLEYHIQISKDENFDCEVRPSFRPDKALKIQGADFVEYINLLGKTENTEIKDYEYDVIGCYLETIKFSVSIELLIKMIRTDAVSTLFIDKVVDVENEYYLTDVKDMKVFSE